MLPKAGRLRPNNDRAESKLSRPEPKIDRTNPESGLIELGIGLTEPKHGGAEPVRTEPKFGGTDVPRAAQNLAKPNRVWPNRAQVGSNRTRTWSIMCFLPWHGVSLRPLVRLRRWWHRELFGAHMR